MKLFKLLFVFLGTCNLYASGQQDIPDMKSKNTLIEQIEHGNHNAILELGNTGDKTIIPYLQKLLQHPNKNFGSIASNTQMALAKLGDEKQLDEILSELNSDTPKVQDDAIKKLSYVRNNKSIKALVQLLDDPQFTKYRSLKGSGTNGKQDEKPRLDRALYEPLSYMAMKALANIVPNPPIDPKTQPTKDHIQKWQHWWENNKGKYK